MAVSRKQIVMAGIIPAIDVLPAVEFLKTCMPGTSSAKMLRAFGRAMTPN